MLTKFFYYFLLKPFSLIPLSVLYYLSDFLYFIIYYVLTYRKKIVFSNLKNSFPDKAKEEITLIAKKFYHHFCDVMVESIKLFSISKEEGISRCKLQNPELMEEFYKKKQSVVVACGHYNNWEFAGTVFDLQIPHQTIAIYAPLSNKFFDRKFKESRGKFGAELISKNDVKLHFEKNKNRITAVVFGNDQCPPRRSKRVYWTRFLNQDTAVMFGTERYATMYNYPVVFMRIKKIKRGYYEYSFEVLEEKSAQSEYCSISKRHTAWLEQQILEAPEFWLWTHKRWKRKKEDDAVVE